jgi:thiamine-phosphate pyrophosphorylase
LTKTLFIVNDYVDVAVAALADGVHLGQEDLSLKQARKILGKNRIIGISCHNLAQALKAQKEGADYIGIGPIYPTATKPGYPGIGLKAAAELKNKIKIPYFAIGNIGEGNIEQITAVGIRRIAVCRAILESGDSQKAAKRLYKKLGNI